jgi:UDP-glucose 4-epimerase
MNALITGGAGFIGSHLAEKLLERGDSVIILDDLSTGSFDNITHLTGNPDFTFVIDSIMNEMVMDRLVSKCDVVFHLAAAVGVELVVKDPVHTIETNVLGTNVILKTANRYRKKVLVASTSEIYGRGVNDSFREDDDRLMGSISNQRWSYACSKSLDEFLSLAYCKQKELPIVICRFFNTVGPRQTGQYGMVVPRFVKQALKNDPITVYGDGMQSRCFCNVSDTVRALLKLAESESAIGEMYNIGNIEEITIIDLANKIIELTGSTSRVQMVPYNIAYGEGFDDMLRRKPDISKIKEHVDWEPEMDLEQTLKQIIAHQSGGKHILS